MTIKHESDTVDGTRVYKCNPSVGIRADGRVHLVVNEISSLDMNSYTARWLAGELLAAADRVDKMATFERESASQESVPPKESAT